MPQREPVLLPMSILAALSFLFSGTAGITILSGYPTVGAISALGALCVAAAQFGIQFYVRGQVTPVAGAPVKVELAPVSVDLSPPVVKT